MRPSPALTAGGRTVANLLSATEWMLPSPATQVHTISVLPSHSPPSPPHHFSFSNLTTAPKRNGGHGHEEGSPRFEVVRDDLLHPLANGNKARKLDALLPLLRRRGATDVVTCGGCQSAHAAATAVHCAEWGMRPHILLRGEQPNVPTGYNLISLMFGNVTYASRSVYAHRDEMLYDHARKVGGTAGTVLWADDIGREDIVLDEDIGSRRVVIIKEGAGDVQALLGLIRLVEYLYNLSSFHKHENVHVVVDAGTGTTAVGLALGAVCLGLHWRVTAVMLADTLKRYKEREKSLISDFKKLCHNNCHEMVGENYIGDSLVEWVERFSPRRFGKVLNGEIALCRQIAQQTGILLDPMYTLAGWEQAVDLCVGDSRTKVVMIHTGGTLGLCGLAQRLKSFQSFTASGSRTGKGVVETRAIFPARQTRVVGPFSRGQTTSPSDREASRTTTTTTSSTTPRERLALPRGGRRCRSLHPRTHRTLARTARRIEQTAKRSIGPRAPATHASHARRLPPSPLDGWAARSSVLARLRCLPLAAHHTRVG
uniref:D-cysteine desulfhydrase n=1 Tax=Oryza punctata TaxID=4537 RepID=A0A0E0JMT4_ORYPU